MKSDRHCRQHLVIVSQCSFLFSTGSAENQSFSTGRAFFFLCNFFSPDVSSFWDLFLENQMEDCETLESTSSHSRQLSSSSKPSKCVKMLRSDLLTLSLHFILHPVMFDTPTCIDPSVVTELLLLFLTRELVTFTANRIVLQDVQRCR